MSAINKALTEVYFQIPKEVLDLAFNDNPAYPLQSLDETIMNRVIRPRVLVDCNLLGGIEIYVPVNKCNIQEFVYDYTVEYLIDVPKALTNGNPIVSVLGLFSPTGDGLMGGANSTDMIAQLSNLMNNVSKPMPISTSRLELIGENKVIVNDPSVGIVYGVMKCVVENNENLSNISPRSYIHFSKLVVLAVKAYIYNSLIVKLGKGYIYQGHELGIINDIISQYSTANEDYLTYLTEVWVKVAFHNDMNRIENHIASMF